MTQARRVFCSKPAWWFIRLLQRTRIGHLLTYTVKARLHGHTLRIPIVRGAGISNLVNG
jgi:hypothetical protein